MIVCKNRLSAFETDQAWALYQPAMLLLERETPFPQCYREEEFREAMESVDFLKCVVLDTNGQIRGLLLVAKNIALVPWLSHRYFENKYPEEYANGALFYIVSIVMDPAYGEEPTAAARMIRLAGDLLPTPGVFCHDFSARHHKRLLGFSRSLARALDSTCEQTDTLIFCETRKEKPFTQSVS